MNLAQKIEIITLIGIRNTLYLFAVKILKYYPQIVRFNWYFGKVPPKQTHEKLKKELPTYFFFRQKIKQTTKNKRSFKNNNDLQ